MRTTLDLPKDLLEEAMKSSGEQTKTAVIVTALEELVRKRNLQELLKLRGTIDLDIDLDTLRKRK